MHFAWRMGQLSDLCISTEKHRSGRGKTVIKEKKRHLQSPRRKTDALHHKLNDVLDSLGLGFWRLGSWEGVGGGNKDMALTGMRTKDRGQRVWGLRRESKLWQDQRCLGSILPKAKGRYQQNHLRRIRRTTRVPRAYANRL